MKAKNLTKNSLKSPSLYTVKKLQLNLNYINWIQLIEMIVDNGKPIKKNTEIYIDHISYFMELRKILKRTPKR